MSHSVKANPLQQTAGVIGALVLCSSLAALICAAIPIPAGMPEWLRLLPESLAYVLPPCLALVLGVWRLGRTHKPPRVFTGDRWRFFACCAAALGLLTVAGDVFGSVLRQALPHDSAAVIPPATAAGWVVLVLCDCLLAPLAETWFYRGMLQQTLRPWGERFALIVTALFAALAHLSLADFIPQLCLALFLGWATLQLGSLRAGAALHIAAALLLFVLRYGVATQYGLNALALTVLVLACYLAAGISGVLFLHRMHPPTPEKRRDARNRQSRAELLLTTPLYTAALITLLGLTVLQSLVE